MAPILPHSLRPGLRGRFYPGMLPWMIRASIRGRFRGRHGCGSVVPEEML
ncbi:hypothetical protein ACWEKR_33085 [Nocardia sp. NPDC004573]